MARNKSTRTQSGEEEMGVEPPPSKLQPRLRKRPTKASPQKKISCFEFVLGKGPLHEAFLHSQNLLNAGARHSKVEWEKQYQEFLTAAR